MSAANSVSYESYAPRSTAQVSRLSKIAALAAPRGMSSSASAAAPTPEDQSGFIAQAMSIPSFAVDEGDYERKEDAPNQTGAESVTAAVCWSEALQRGDQLTQSIKHTVSLRLAVRASINIAEDLSASHAALIRHSGELTRSADRLSDEAKALEEHAEELGRPLQHYNAVDQLGPVVGVLFKGATQVVRGLAKIKVDEFEEFLDVLDKIDKAVNYFERESGGKEALQAWQKQNSQRRGGTAALLSGNLEYFRRSLALQDAALYLIQEAVAERIKTTSDQIVATMLSQQASSGRGNAKTVIVPADQLEASLIYTRFHGISSRSNRLLTIVQNRLHKSQAYYDLWQTCLMTYCQCREQLLRETVRTHLENLNKQHGCVGMTRLASVFLTRLCTVETNLYHDFFTDQESTGGGTEAKASLPTPDSQFTNYMIGLCSNLHRSVRRSLVSLLDLDTLCQVVAVLREEGQQATRQAVTLPAGRAMARLMEDAQERVIFCAHSTLQKQVIRYKATPRDLDYPDKLMKKDEGNAESSVEEQLEKVYDLWFPPVRSVLKILSKIFRVVEAKVFEDMALQSVQACSKALFDGAKFIERRSGVRHSDLFLVKHLLILREQLSPFDIELRSVERQLDFSDAGKAVTRFLTNRNRRIFSMSTENALVTLLREGVSVQESPVDSKRDLEDALRKACNGFIDHTVQSLAAPLLELDDRLKNTETGSLAQLALLQPDSVNKVIEETVEKVDAGIQEVLEQMVLYLENAATQSILLKPVGRKIVKASEEMRRWVSKCEEGENDWNDEIRTRLLQKLEELEQSVKKFGKTSRS